jgi:hypothetical protein
MDICKLWQIEFVGTTKRANTRAIVTVERIVWMAQREGA